MARLDGKVAIVTGAARGIGAAIATALSAEKASVVIADVLEKSGRETSQKLQQAGGKAEYLTLDVRDAAHWASVVSRAVELFGRIDCLVNNAGINMPRTIDDATAEEFRAILDVNLIGAFLGMKAVAPIMRAQGGGSIVNISSNSTDKVVPLTAIYGASKAALANLTKTAAVHFAQTRSGIRVNSIHPGPIATEMLLGDGEADIPEVRQLIDNIPMGRMGEPLEIGSVAAFLASDDSRYMTAAELLVDGGLTAV